MVVTGATGGVGSLAVAILSKLGYEVTAVTRRLQHSEYLNGLGATEVLSSDSLSAEKRPIGKERWAGAIDSVGGPALEWILPSLAYGTSVAACGLAGGTEWTASVIPFILRGVRLIGVDSVRSPVPRRSQAWARLDELGVADLPDMVTTCGLEEVADRCRTLLEGHHRGRTVVEV